MSQISVSFRGSTQVQDYIFLEQQLPRGRFCVFRCSAPSRKDTYALKIFPKDAISKAHYSREKYILSILNHQNIIQYISIFGHAASHKFDIIITKYATFGNLMNMTKVGLFYGQVKLVRTYFRQLIDGLQYIHSKDVAHLDIKPENLFIGEDLLLKIGDFDLSHQVGERKLISGGTVDFRAPEIIDQCCYNVFASDIYSAGVVLYYLLIGETPFIETRNSSGASKLLYYDVFCENNGLFWEIRNNWLGKLNFINADLIDLIQGMLTKDPKERWDFKKIKACKWYNGSVCETRELKTEIDYALSSKSKSSRTTGIETAYW